MIKPKFVNKKCPHNNRQARCKECKGGSTCEHNGNKYHCKDCGGKGICIHRRQKHECKDCGGSEICEHRRLKARCKECHLRKYLLALYKIPTDLDTFRATLEICGIHVRCSSKITPRKTVSLTLAIT